MHFKAHFDKVINLVSFRRDTFYAYINTLKKNKKASIGAQAYSYQNEAYASPSEAISRKLEMLSTHLKET